MSVTVIVVNGQNVNLVAIPASPALRSVQFEMDDQVAVVTSPFTGQTQAQQWPGADMWRGTMTLPPLQQSDANNWISFLMELRGMANAMQLGDPLKTTPSGSVAGTPLVDDTINGGNLAGTQSLGTKGWTASAAGVLLPGDYIQVGFRLYRVLDTVNASSSGGATINIWPSLRETPTDSSPLITTNPLGLFRLSTNKRTWAADVTRLTQISFAVQEYR